MSDLSISTTQWDAVCSRCGATTHPTHFHSNGVPMTPGYGNDKEGKIVCYRCCALEDLRIMREQGKYVLYLVKTDQGQWQVTNWPGSLRFKCSTPDRGRHNLAKCRYDVRFAFEGYWWRGTQYGENTQICHVRRTKETTQANYLLEPKGENHERCA